MDYPKSVPNVGLVDGQFADENPATGQVGSLIPSAWGNAVTQELLSVIKAAGFVPAEGQTNQLLKAIQGLVSQGIKNSVRVATTGAIALSGVQTIDAIVLVAGDRVLVKNQASGAQNGIYVVATGAWVRALDADESVEVKPGMLVGVDAGTVNGGSVWRLSNAEPPTLGTTALTFEQVFGKTGVVAGSYRSVKVGADGRVTEGTNPTTLAGFGITDAFTKAESNAAMQAAIDALVGSAPDALNAINELAAALGNDPNFETTILNLLAGKADKANTFNKAEVEALASALSAEVARITPMEPGMQVFATPGTFDFVVPMGAKATSSFEVEVWGAGGGGAGGFGNGPSAGGGGGGGYAFKRLVGLMPGATVKVTIGAGGAAGPQSTSGQPGGTSSFGDTLSATGGRGGIALSTTSPGSLGGLGIGGDLNFAGGCGEATEVTLGGNGGMAACGGGGGLGGYSGIGGAGTTPGGGGGGGDGVGAAAAGGVGGAGMVVVRWR